MKRFFMGMGLRLLKPPEQEVLHSDRQGGTSCEILQALPSYT